jgi:thymidine kinase
MEPKKGTGRLEVVCGSMFSGKTEEMLRRLRRAEFAKQNVLTIKHSIDKRKNMCATNIVSHQGRERNAFIVSNDLDNIEKILELANKNIDVVGIDEIQFFPQEIIKIICTLVESGKRVIVAGLDLDFRGEPFGITPALLAIADEVLKLKAICVVCGKDAYHTQRIVNGKPARYADPVILVGAEECYEARCRNCFEIDRMPSFMETKRDNEKHCEQKQN